MDDSTATLTPSQRDRRQRILTSALDLAADGGFDGVQMRDVAEQADVALGTLYRYFPSKEHLLVSAMHQSIGDLRSRLDAKPPRGATPTERVVDVLSRANRFLQRRPKMSAAMVTALASADSSLGPVVREVTGSMQHIITEAMHPDGCEPVQRDLDCAAVLQDVWLARLVGWVTGAIDGAAVDTDLERAATLLLSPSEP